MPRAWKQRREYKPGAPLYAKLDLKFSGRPVKSGEMIPPEYIRSERDHLRLWRSGHASHEQRNRYAEQVSVVSPASDPAPAVRVFENEVAAMAHAVAESVKSPPPSVAPAALPAATAQATEAAVVSAAEITEAELEKLTAPSAPSPRGDRRGRSR